MLNCNSKYKQKRKKIIKFEPSQQLNKYLIFSIKKKKEINL